MSRERSERNKIVSILTAVSASAVTIEQGAPGLLPPGTGVVTGQLLSLVALAVNLFWPR